MPRIVLVLGGALAWSDSAHAAKPITGAHYYGFDGQLRDLDLPLPTSSPRYYAGDDTKR